MKGGERRECARAVFGAVVLSEAGAHRSTSEQTQMQPPVSVLLQAAAAGHSESAADVSRAEAGQLAREPPMRKRNRVAAMLFATSGARHLLLLRRRRIGDAQSSGDPPPTERLITGHREPCALPARSRRAAPPRPLITRQTRRRRH